MKLTSSHILIPLLVLASSAAAQDRQGLSLVAAEPLYASKVTATGRIVPLLSSRIGPRVSGHLAEFGADADGRPLDAGMPVKAGQVLFRLRDTTFLNNRAVAEAALKSAQANLANLTAKTREERLEQLRQSLAELDARITDRKREEDRYRRLVEQDKTLPARRLEEVQTDLAIMAAQRKSAEARLREAETGPTATEIALAQARVNEAEAALKIANADLADIVVKAPFDGVITRRFKSVGDYIVNMPPTEVIEVVSDRNIEAELRLPEAYFPAVEAGKTVVELNSPLLKQKLSLIVTRVVGEIDPAAGTFAVRLAIPAESAGLLVPGAFVEAEVNVDGKRSGVIVPIRAIVMVEGKAAVFVAEGGKMVRRFVEVGDRLTEGAIIKNNLAGGEQLVVGPAELLKDGSELPAYLKRAPVK